MRLFKIFGEMTDLGDEGTIYFGVPQYRYPSQKAVVLKFAVAMMMVYVVIYTIQRFHLHQSVVSSSVIAGYFFVAYFVHPIPDRCGIRWFSLLIDIPFCVSDDHHRFLLFLEILLSPGLFMMSSVIDFSRLFITPGFITK
ncbi:hypothetical protein [Candidatus Uabimicrobium amorphum]|uniref:Uncharacterized protein n=1 Tax=Uabimicrobium amorphum TaxID=2596890 RepID=A0A5S9ISB4_UABAM|nr:hypothetical protein [Candidatus Uabimicrobium amorphum]BBM86696.1 hypothetical protein UABAM_05082 [Candidatus Uabimicrobium amorphum]